MRAGAQSSGAPIDWASLPVNSMTRDGVLNGLPPFKADFGYSDLAEDVLWHIRDDEGSEVAAVSGGEEMATFFAEKLNELAASCPECGATARSACHTTNGTVRWDHSNRPTRLADGKRTQANKESVEK